MWRAERRNLACRMPYAPHANAYVHPAQTARYCASQGVGCSTVCSLTLSAHHSWIPKCTAQPRNLSNL
eukprot:392169-Pyramimonas_sp.AAC.1